MNSQTTIYADALRRFFDWSGLQAAELAELAGVEVGTLLEALAGHQLPSAADRGLIADEITAIRRERA